MRSCISKMLLFITLSTPILFPPIFIFAALHPPIFWRLRVGWYGPLVANLHGGDSALGNQQPNAATVHLMLFAKLRDGQILH